MIRLAAMIVIVCTVVGIGPTLQAQAPIAPDPVGTVKLLSTPQGKGNLESIDSADDVPTRMFLNLLPQIARANGVKKESKLTQVEHVRITLGEAGDPDARAKSLIWLACYGNLDELKMTEFVRLVEHDSNPEIVRSSAILLLTHAIRTPRVAEADQIEDLFHRIARDGRQPLNCRMTALSGLSMFRASVPAFIRTCEGEMQDGVESIEWRCEVIECLRGCVEYHRTLTPDEAANALIKLLENFKQPEAIKAKVSEVMNSFLLRNGGPISLDGNHLSRQTLFDVRRIGEAIFLDNRNSTLDRRRGIVLTAFADSHSPEAITAAEAILRDPASPEELRSTLEKIFRPADLGNKSSLSDPIK